MKILRVKTDEGIIIGVKVEEILKTHEQVSTDVRPLLRGEGNIFVVFKDNTYIRGVSVAGIVDIELERIFKIPDFIKAYPLTHIAFENKKAFFIIIRGEQ